MISQFANAATVVRGMKNVASPLRQRVLTAIVLMAALIGFSTLLPPFYFAVFIGIVLMLAAWEWCGFIGLDTAVSKLPYLSTIAVMIAALFYALGVTPLAVSIDNVRAAAILFLGLVFWLLAFLILRSYPENTSAWNDRSRIALMGLCALLPTWVGFVQLKYLLPQGYLVLALIVMVAAVDIGAFFVGTAFGHTKLAPRLSPNKSWEGVWGGLLTCFILGVILTWAFHHYISPLSLLQMTSLICLSLTVTFFGVTGDLVESMLKRNCDVKDSGTILPGHGGLLDRVDGLMAVTPVFVLIVLFTLTDLG